MRRLWKWQEAHDKLDAGDPIDDPQEWKAIHRSLNWFYWGQGGAFIVLVILFVVFVGIPQSRKNDGEFEQQCKARGGVIERGFFIRCVGGGGKQ